MIPLGVIAAVVAAAVVGYFKGRWQQRTFVLGVPPELTVIFVMLGFYATTRATHVDAAATGALGVVVGCVVSAVVAYATGYGLMRAQKIAAETYRARHNVGKGFVEFVDGTPRCAGEQFEICVEAARTFQWHMFTASVDAKKFLVEDFFVDKFRQLQQVMLLSDVQGIGETHGAGAQPGQVLRLCLRAISDVAGFACRLDGIVMLAEGESSTGFYNAAKVSA